MMSHSAVPDPSPLCIGILGIQGAFVEHAAALRRLDPSIRSVIIRSPADLDATKIDGLILPGGESTTMSIVAERTGLLGRLRQWVGEGRPVMVSYASHLARLTGTG